MRTHYDVLGVTTSTEASLIRKAYHRIALVSHPDKTRHLPATERAAREKTFKEASNAWEILSDAEKRKVYDKTLRVRVPLAATPHSWTRPRSPPRKRPSRGSAVPRDCPPRPPPRQPPPEPFAAPKWKYPQTAPQLHPFTRGSPPGTFLGPWFYAPVHESPLHTTLNFLNSAGWEFSICVCKRFKLLVAPLLPTSVYDTTTLIEIILQMERDRSGVNHLFMAMRDVTISMKKTPDSRQVALASLFKEAANGIELKLTISTSFNPAVKVPITPLEWQFAFDADHGFLAAFCSKMKATHLLFYPGYPAHVFPDEGGASVQMQNGHPIGSPMQQLAADLPAIQFVNMPQTMYCKQMTWKGKSFYQLCAVGEMTG